MKPVATKKIRTILTSKGCTKSEASGDHEKWTTPQGLSTTITQTKEQSPGLLRNVQKAFEEEFGPGWLQEEVGK